MEFWTEGDYKELTEGVDYTITFEGSGIDPIQVCRKKSGGTMWLLQAKGTIPER